MKILKSLLALFALAPVSHGDILVNLDATSRPAGDLATWANTGTLGGNFTSAGATIPKVVSLALPVSGSVNAVRLTNIFTHYQGPSAPVSLTANNSPRTVEAWVLNATVAAEETIFAWGRRGTDAMNSSFNYGSNAVYGAAGHFGSAYDVGWGTTPTAGVWHHLVYTYDGTTARLYVDGVERNSRAVALNTASVSTGGGALPFRIGAQSEASGAVNSAIAASMDIGRLRVRNELLTLSQIQSIYASEGPTFGRAEPSVGSFAASTTSTLPGQNVTLNWNLVNATSATINQGIGAVSATSGSIVVSPIAATTYTITATNAAGSATSSVTITPLAAIQLRNRWSFSNLAGAAANGTQVNDSAGTAHGFIRGTGATFTGTQTSLPGGASASAPYIDLPNGIISTLNEATLEGWMTLNGSQNWSRYFDFGVGSAGELTAPGGAANGVDVLLLAAQVGGDTTQRRIAMMDAGVEQGVNFPDTTNVGTQFHFAVVYKVSGAGGVVSYYKNGVLVGQLNTSYRLQNINDVNNWLGRSNWTSDANTQGSYNEFRIWNGALPQSAIADATSAGPDLLPQFPRVDAFTTAGNSTIYRGESARLSYVLADPASLGISASVNQGVGSIAAPTGFVDVSPVATTTYTLTVVNSAGSRTATTTVNVLPSEPTANNLAAQVNYETPTAITLTASDPNTPTGSLTYAVVSGPVSGVLSGTGATRTYTPNAGFFGADSFTFQANDGTSNSNVATVSVTVLPPPAAPTDIVPNDTSIRTTAVNGSFIANLRPIDPNPTDTFTLALVAGAGDTHNGYFTLNGTQLISSRSFSADLGQTVTIRVRVTDNTGRTFDKVLTFPVLAPDLHVKINEVHYNPARNTMRTEFVELYNPTPASVDLGGWRFDSGVDYIFPVGTTIAPGAYLVVASHPPTMAAFYGVTALGPWTGGLDSLGEEIVLRDAAGNRVDGVDYGISAPWPATPNGDGPTLELVHPSLDNDHGSNWLASTAAPVAVNYLPAGSTGWRYRKGTSEASSPMGAWHAETFTLDGTWLTGTAPIGVYYQNSATPLAANAETGVTLATQLTDMATFSGGTFTVNYRSVYFRKTFNVSGTIPKQLLLRVQHNDAAIVWINGTEIARFGFPPTSVGDAAFNSTAVYERGNDPWSEVVIANADSLLHSGTNTIAIHGLSKAPQTRSDQEDFGNYNVFDFSVDAALTNVPETLGTPGAQNSVFSPTSGPVIRSIGHTPKAPISTQPVTVTARVSDPQGVGAVTLSYQVVAPGNFIPSTLPLTNAQILANPSQSLPANPAFELVANWTTIPMVDDGSVAGDVVGDGIYTAIIPAQAHRTLVRYRISANDLSSLNTRVPAPADPRKNFAFFVYDGVPTYVAGSASFSPATLNTLPAYHWLTRAGDFSNLLAYNGAEQFANTPALADLNARRFENFEGALVVGDQVVDHTLIRLRGGNSRYNGNGKRHFRFVFPKGTPFQAADEAGREYPRPWEDMLFNKLFGNKGYYDFGLPYEIGGKMWSLSGVPIPESHWVHFRVIRDADQSHATLGDFWGLYQALELPDGPNFLKARNLERGNFYKMSDWMQNGEMSQRSQAPLGVDFAEDFDNVRYNIHQTASDAYLEQYVNMPLYYKYDAVKEAIRHYDVFVEPTGRHRVKNLIWYFQPVDGNPLGKLWHMPYDWDASFGPNWNQGWDLINNAIYDRFDIVDSPTWALPKQTPRTAISIAHRNAIRELRDLLVYREVASGRGPVDDIMDDAAAKLAAFYPADIARWPAPGAVANYPGGVPSKIADMKAFLFTGWTDTAGGGDPAVGAGGRAAYLDTISDGVDAGLLPAKPVISNASVVGNPIDGIALTSSAFSDPQGTVTFGGMQWRIGEVTDPAAPAFDPAAERIYEMTEVWTSGELATFNATITVPANVLKVGRSYRARVRHKDSTGRYGHWSEPVSFVTTGANYAQIIRNNLLITEVMYHPAPVSLAAEFGRVEEDFEFIELQNISPTLTLDLSNVNFDRGVDFDFFGSAVTSLAPGQRVLVVANVAAFESRYGTGKPIAGTWEAGDVLSNAGERLRLVFGVSDIIHDFTYDDVAPWPVGADVGGYSLVLINPGTHGALTSGASWRASARFGGTAGENGTVFSEWAAQRGVSAPLGDDDKDGIVNQLEYAFSGVPTTSDQSPLPSRAIQNIAVSGVPADYFTLTFRRVAVAEDLTYSVEFTSDLGTTWSAGGAFVSSTPQPDGSTLETWRAPTPATPGTKHFGRVKVVRP
jgi:hypothetical protein